MQIPEEYLRANVVITPHSAFNLSFRMWLVPWSRTNRKATAPDS
jgi:hypothetical protein